ncbi:hypothetical protein [Halobacteriaceae bacterium SHR40]|uniref:hypothetical protein n=1 Tax=Halovenus amylolytica TaxID=2500550 RepID=UPI000FE377EE
MSNQDNDPPVHESLTVIEFTDIYRTEEWWKAVVRYRLESNSEETAIYLWHNDDDDGWTRKNKYVIKTEEAWETDRQVIKSLLDGQGNDGDFPVSDYYNIDAGTTVSKSDDWWKAIVRIDQKGSYETEEVIVYLWQYQDDKWRRRQKYAIKDNDSWAEERDIISSMLSDSAGQVSPGAGETPATATDRSDTSTSEPIDSSIMKELEEIGDDIEKHLSETLDN